MPTRFRAALVVGIIASSVALTGCSTLTGFLGDAIPADDSVHILVPGDCFDNTKTIITSEAVIDIPRTNCTLPHDNRP